MRKIALAACMLTCAAAPSFGAGYSFLNAGIDYLNQARFADAVTWLDKALAAGDLTPDQMRIAYIDRAIAHGDLGDLKAMVSDYSMALTSKPEDPFVTRQRGLAYAAMGEYEKAAADFIVARRKYPKDREIASQEAFASWRIGRYEQSAAAFAQLSSFDITYWLFFRLANRRAGKPLPASDDQQMDLAQWPGPLKALYTGKIEEKEILESRSRMEGAEACDANFYVGAWRVSGGKPGGIELLRKAAEVCSRGSVEKEMANLEVERQSGGKK